MPELDERWTVSGWNRWVCHEGVVCLSASELCQDLQPLEPVWKEVQLMAWSLPSSLEIGTPPGLDSIDIVIGKQRHTSWWCSAQNRSVLLFSLEPNRHIRVFAKSFGSSYLSGKEFTDRVKGMKLVREKQNFTVNWMNPLFIIEVDQSQLFPAGFEPFAILKLQLMSGIMLV